MDAVVTMDVTNYIEKTEIQLTRNITTNYQKIKQQQTTKQLTML